MCGYGGGAQDEQGALDHADRSGRTRLTRTVLARTAVPRITVAWIAIGDRGVYGDNFEDIGRRIPDIGEARAVLGWTPRVGLPEGIENTVRWWREPEI